MFEVMIIPMVNPDGVFDGNYRMDLNNTNLIVKILQQSYFIVNNKNKHIYIYTLLVIIKKQ